MSYDIPESRFQTGYGVRVHRRGPGVVVNKRWNSGNHEWEYDVKMDSSKKVETYTESRLKDLEAPPSLERMFRI